uniref:Formin-like protein n=1 Tax=Oryza punctata TaxID=4537 RepID=A0A0E0LLW0_ORYPU
MRHCRREWLLTLCLISGQLLIPTDCEGVLVAASDMSPPALTPPLINQVDQLVEHAWVKCGLDRRTLEDVRRHFNYNHVLAILRRMSGQDSKDTSTDIDEGTSVLSPEIRHTILNCLSKQNFMSVAGQDGAKFLSADYIKALIASLRTDLAQESSATKSTPEQAGKPVPEKTPTPKPVNKPTYSVSSPPDRSYKSAPTEKENPPTKSVAEKKRDSSGMPTAIISLSIAGIALMALLCLCCFMCGGTSSSDLRDDKPLLTLNLSNLSAASKSSQGNPIDVNKLGVVSLKSEAGQNGDLKLNSKEGANNVNVVHPVGSVSESTSMPSPVMPPPEGANNVNMVHPVGSVSESTPMQPPVIAPPEGANNVNMVHPVGCVSESTAMQPPVMPPPVTTPPIPKPLSPPAPQPPTPPLKASVPPPEPSPTPAPKAAPPPPPPESTGPGPPSPPPPAMPSSSKIRPPPPIKKSGPKAGAVENSNEAKAKLKPFFWDKVTANPAQSMVWDHLKSGSFQFNEQMMESLFGYNSTDKSSDTKKDLSSKDAAQLVRILDPKKAQNLAISLKALGVSPQEVCSAVKEGSELPSDLIQTLIRWTPSNDEELRLRLYTGELFQLGPAEQFLRVIIDIPYIFQRLDALLFMANLPEEASNVKQSFATLEVACQELRNSRLFLKLLEAVLKTGNRMNVGTFRGGAQAFRFDTLLKLSDVKGTDGKTTLLHFVVQEIIRSEGVRAERAAKEQNSSVSSVKTDNLSDNSEQTEDGYKQLGLKVVSSLGDELQDVRKAAILDADQLTMLVASLGHKLVKTNEFLNTSMKSLDEDSGFHRKLTHFVQQSQTDITFLLEEEKKIRSLVKDTVDYFHGSVGKDEGLRLFVIVRDFLAMLDNVCKEVKEASKVAPVKAKAKQPSQTLQSFRDPRVNLFPVTQHLRVDSSSSSSDDES